MFIGHFPVGFASKRFAPRTNVDPPSSVNQLLWFGVIAECIIIPWAVVV